MESLPLILFGS